MLLDFLRRGLQRTSDGVEQEIKVFFGLDELMSISSFGTVHCLASFSKAHTFLCVLSEIPRDLSAGKLRDINLSTNTPLDSSVRKDVSLSV